MNTIARFICVMLFVQFSFSQSANNLGAVNSQNYLEGNDGNIINTSSAKSSSITGSQYLSEEFESCKISTMPGKVFGVRYNAFKDEMELKRTDNKIYAINKYDIDAVFTFTSSKVSYHVFDYLSSDSKKESVIKGYFTKLHPEGPNYILKKNMVLFFPEKVSVSGYDTAKPATYKKVKDRTYIKLANKEAAVLLETNKKKLVKQLFPSNSKVILGFIKSNKIKLKKDADLIKFAAFLNTL